MPLATSISINHDVIRVQKNGGYIYLTAMVQPSGACACVTWRSANNNIASVNPNTGYVFGIDVGTTTIYAETNDGSDLSASVSVTVFEKIDIQSITFNKQSLSLKKHEVSYVIPTILPENATYKQLVWVSSDPTVATVSEYGLVRCTGAGTAQITATAIDGSEQSATITIQGRIGIQRIRFTGPVSMQVNDTPRYVQPSIYPASAANGAVLCWSSSNPSVVTVNPYTGLLMPQGTGFATISVCSKFDPQIRAYCSVTVGEPTEVVGVSVQERLLLPSDGEMTLEALVSPWSASNKTVTWQSDNTAVAEVSNSGKVTAHSPGHAIITVTTNEGGYTASCAVTVYDNSKTKATIHTNGEEVTYITFSTGKQWEYLGVDMIFSMPEAPSYANPVLYAEDLLRRCNLNFYGVEDPDTAPKSSFNVAAFTNEDLRFLFPIDPHGVAKYVEMYADYYHVNDTAGKITYKNSVFSFLFNREEIAYYFKGNNDWIKVQNSVPDITHCISEAELLFGTHPVTGLDTVGHVFYIIADLCDLAANAFPLFKLDAYLYRISATLMCDNSANNADLQSYVTRKGIEFVVDKCGFGWINSLVSLYEDLESLAQYLQGPNLPSFPDYTPITSHYTAFVVMPDKYGINETFLLEDMQSDLNQLVLSNN